MEPIYRKLNYLVAQTAPNYKGTRMRTPYMKLTIGDWFNKLPGVLSSVSLNYSKDYPWEIKLDKDGQDKNMLMLPHVLDVSVTFLPIHSMRPENEVDAPFISIDKWLTYGIADFTNPNIEGFQEDYEDLNYTDSDMDTFKVAVADNAYKNLYNKVTIKSMKENLENSEIVQPDSKTPPELNFTQKLNKFKKYLSNRGVGGAIQDIGDDNKIFG